MLTDIEVFTSGIPTPPLAIVDQNESEDSIQITNVDGLGPVTATINTTQYGSLDGEFLNGSSTPKRNIVLTVQLNPDWANESVETLRQILYLYFMPKNAVTLRFSSTHMPTVQIDGVVESCEPNMFAADPVYQVSIICPMPYFTAVDQTVINGTTFGLTDTTDTIIPYQGTVDTGFVIDFTSLDTNRSGEIRVFDNTGITKLLIVSNTALTAANLLEISTVQGNKYVQYEPINGGIPTNILSKIAAGSSWINLSRGDNHMQMLSTVAGLAWALSYYAKYGGL